MPDRHNSFCKYMQGGYKRIGKVCQLECATGVGDQREDLTIPELGLHFDVVIGVPVDLPRPRREKWRQTGHQSRQSGQPLCLASQRGWS